MKIAITGGAGYIGSHAAKHLRSQGHTVRVFDNLSRGHRWAVQWGELVQLDLSDRPALVRALQDFRPDAVLHFAAFASVGESVEDPGLYYRNNCVGSLTLLEAMVECGVENLIFSSTCAVYGTPQGPLNEDHPTNPINPYGASKLMTERMIADFVQRYSLRACALRYFNAAGADPEAEIGEDHNPELHLIPNVFNAILEKRPMSVFGNDFPTPDGTCVRDYIHVLDLASAHRLALERLVEGASLRPAYNLGLGKGYSVLDVIGAVGEVVGTHPEINIQGRRAGDPASLVADARRAADELGWRPQWTELSAVVESAWKWHRRHFAERANG